MKKIFLYIAITLGLLSCNHKDSLWQEVVEDLDERVETLEMLCAEMNTNITSLQTIVDVLQSNDFITSIVEIKKDGKVVGYTITFGKHDPITIYHGQDGKDGQNGTNGKDGADGKDGQDGENGDDGKDGSTPVIGVAQDTDGVYYWTLNGEWLLDDNGNKLPVSGKDGKDGANGTDGQDGQDGTDGKDGITPLLKIENGYWYISYDNGATWTESGKATGDNGQNGQNGSDGKDGQDGQNGTDGKDGQDGQDGKDGVTPQLKIEEGYWFISYDNGATWTQLGKATGEDGKDGIDGEDGKDGQNGTDGKDGQDGDSMFQSVTQDENYVYFTLADGTVIKIAKASKEEQPNSEFIFTITYAPNGGEGVMVPDTFYYGISKVVTLTCFYTRENYYFTEWNTRPDGSGVTYAYGTKISIDKNIILYAQWEKALGTPAEYVDLGLSVKWATYNVGATTPEEYGDYFAWGEVKSKIDYTEYNYKYYDYKYYGYTKYNPTDKKKVLDIIDDAARMNWGGKWRMPSDSEWGELISQCTWEWDNEKNGYVVTSQKEGYTQKSIFLPAAGYKGHAHLSCNSAGGHYWKTSLGGSISSYDTGERFAECICFSWSNTPWGHTENRYSGLSIRPVCP
ncbi:MAG: InlB B-repeat-containing protein [Paludibacteraceae bacterium]|nr:InlB B-repeat-containing protein [Paludibacteraceae bacterium]